MFEHEYHSSVNFDADFKSAVEIKEFLISMSLRGSRFYSTHTYKTDLIKVVLALAVVCLKSKVILS